MEDFNIYVRGNKLVQETSKMLRGNYTENKKRILNIFLFLNVLNIANKVVN